MGFPYTVIVNTPYMTVYKLYFRIIFVYVVLKEILDQIRIKKGLFCSSCRAEHA